MNTTVRKFLLVGTSLAASALAAPALAHGDRDDYGRDRYWHRHHHGASHAVHERVIVHERPVFVERRVVQVYEPRPVYVPRDPAVVVRVDLPPLVFPLR